MVLDSLLPEPLRGFLGTGTFRAPKQECPLCGTRSRRFRPRGWDVPVLKELQVVGAGRRQGVVCPRCKSTDRERLVHLYLQRSVHLAPGTRLLHIAPERALGRWLRQTLGSGYISADLASRRAMLRFDLQAIPLREGAFDVVICNHVLEHVPDDRKAMREIRRVLRPGGWAIVQVPFSSVLEVTREDSVTGPPALREERYGQHDHLRLYGRDFPSRLASAGFEVEAWRFEERFGIAELRRFGLQRDETLHLARKC